MSAILKWILKSFLSDPDKIQATILSLLEGIDPGDKKFLALVVESAKAILGNDEAFELLYSLIVELLGNQTEGIVGAKEDLIIARATAISEAVGDTAKIDPATIIVIINAAIELIKWLRERRQAA